MRGDISIGHNALAGFIYFLTFLAFLFQSATGFALYASMSHSWLPHLFAWIVPLMGGDFRVRQWHHAMMWFFILFAIVHVYLVFYHDYIEGREQRPRWSADGSSCVATLMAEGSGLLVLGIGNVLMGDESVGVHVIRHLEKASYLPT